MHASTSCCSCARCRDSGAGPTAPRTSLGAQLRSSESAGKSVAGTFRQLPYLAQQQKSLLHPHGRVQMLESDTRSRSGAPRISGRQQRDSGVTSEPLAASAAPHDGCSRRSGEPRLSGDGRIAPPATVPERASPNHGRAARRRPPRRSCASRILHRSRGPAGAAGASPRAESRVSAKRGTISIVAGRDKDVKGQAGTSRFVRRGLLLLLLRVFKGTARKAQLGGCVSASASVHGNFSLSLSLSHTHARRHARTDTVPAHRRLEKYFIFPIITVYIYI